MNGGVWIELYQGTKQAVWKVAEQGQERRGDGGRVVAVSITVVGSLLNRGCDEVALSTGVEKWSAWINRWANL